jgi:splicing factor U2AF subunit
LEEIEEEANKFGKVLELKIPRPSGARSSPGVGKVFIKFDTPESAQKATAALAGRKFADRTVVITDFSEVCSALLSHMAFRSLLTSHRRNTLM